MKHAKYQIMITILTLLVFSQFGFSETVIKHPNPKQTLAKRWAWALDRAKDKNFNDGFWIGYSIEKWMGENSFIGSFRGDAWDEEVSLSEIIYGEKVEVKKSNLSDNEVIRETATKALKRIYDADTEKEKIQTDVAILFRFDRSRAIQRVKISNLSLHVDLENLPLIWLDNANYEQSLALIDKMYTSAGEDELKEKMLTAAGIHESSEYVVSFLKKGLHSDESTEVREKAAFWLGQQDREDALKILVGTAHKDKSIDVRKKAVFGLSQMNLAAATDAMIDLAQNGENEEVRKQAIFWLGQKENKRALKLLIKIANSDESEDVREKAVFVISQQKNETAVEALIQLAKESKSYNTRKKAIFWLGQKASKKAGEVLTDVAFEDEDYQIQKQAVFALSQLPNDGGVTSLIKICKSHPNPKVRKKAVFWLGQSDDPRALETLVEIVRK